MITCLTGSIGIIGCGTTTPVSGLFLNSLPGISLKSIEYVADAEQKNYLGVVADIELRAQARLTMDVYKELSKRYKITNITQSIDVGTRIDLTVTKTAAAEYRGILFDLDPALDNAHFKTSALQNHYLQSVQFYSPAIKANATVKVFDYDTGTLLETFTQSFVVGWNTIVLAINKTYSARRLFIGVDSTTFNSIKLEIPATVNGCAYGNCASYIRAGYVTIGSAFSTFTESNNSYGLSVKYGVRCKWDNVVCNNKDQFYYPYWYLLGSELMQERLTSERVNQWTVNKKDASQLKAHFDTEYEDLIKQTLENLNLDESDCCLECDGIYTIKEAGAFYPSC